MGIYSGNYYGSAGANGTSASQGPGAGGVGLQIGQDSSLTGTIIGGGGGSAPAKYKATGGAGGNGVSVTADGVSLQNAGGILGGLGGNGYGLGGAGGIGINFTASGTLTNGAGGTISGGFGGKSLGGVSPNSKYSKGGAGGDGVRFAAYGTVHNAGAINGATGGDTSGQIKGTPGIGVDLSQGGRLFNTGTITGGSLPNPNQASNSSAGTGVFLGAPGYLNNQGTIQGGAGGVGGGVGVSLAAGGTVVNEGTITGGSAKYGGTAKPTALLFGGDSRLIVGEHAVFNGQVVANGGNDTIELENTTAPGTLSGLGSQFTGFEHLKIDSGGSWTVNLDPSKFSGDIAGLSSNDSLHLSNVDISGGVTSHYDETTGDLTITAGGTDYHVHFAPGSGPQTFTFTSDGAGGTVVTNNGTPCFCPGTLILTEMGEVPVENLKIGDRLITPSGVGTTVRWIGRRSRNMFSAALSNGLPVQIAAGALGEGLPKRDLYVSPDHALYLQGCLVHAAALVNGRTITQGSHVDFEVRYYHIETQRHELIFAEGAPTETFIDNDARHRFDNAAEFVLLYPDAEPMQELDLPRVSYQRQLPKAISRRLEAIADELMGRAAIAA